MILDRSQQEIVAIKNEHALVLAGPGCGKTHILARRIIAAHGFDGVEFDDMVCLTFTNRASREMATRIADELGYKPEGLFVGNIHRFCIKFLYDNALLPDDVSVIDEDDRDLWLSESLGLRRAFECKQVLDLVILLFEQEHGFPPTVMRRLDFTAGAAHINAATAYRDYKAENRLVDFDDVLLLAYDALLNGDRKWLRYCNYHWLQVDEVQDLTPLQLAIVDMISSPDGATVVFLGDEQQAIFEFIGAGGPALDKLKQRCRNHTYRLRRNYRSPGYLVGLCNDFAVFRLGIHPGDLPAVEKDDKREAGMLQLLPATDFTLGNAVAAKVREWRDGNKDERLAVLVRTNDEAEQFSGLLSRHGIGHMLVSRKDLFKQVAYKTVFAHFAVVANCTQAVEWARLLYQIRAVKTMTEARSLVYNLRELGATPADIMADDSRTVLRRVVEDFETGEVVVFDTETTGLNLFEDDIIQIAAVKYRCGKKVDDGGFEVMIETSKSIPPMLRDGMVNPMVGEYRCRTDKLPAAEAFLRFAEYVGDAVLCGHNVMFDIDMLRNNCRRHGVECFGQAGRNAIDTLLVSRLLFPILHSHTLEAMLEKLGVVGVNSHRATDDASATGRLLGALYKRAFMKIGSQLCFLESPVMERVASKMREVYKPIYDYTVGLRSYAELCEANTLSYELDRVYNEFVEYGIISPIERWWAVVEFIRDAVTGNVPERRFRDQADAHLHELRTFNEGDLLAGGKIEERVAVMTVHKAKGLEFENVVVYDASERNYGKDTDKARVFYVAFSRAKRRLAVFYSGRLSGSVGSVAHHFEQVSEVEVEAMALLERLHERRP